MWLLLFFGLILCLPEFFNGGTTRFIYGISRVKLSNNRKIFEYLKNTVKVQLLLLNVSTARLEQEIRS